MDLPYYFYSLTFSPTWVVLKGTGGHQNNVQDSVKLSQSLFFLSFAFWRFTYLWSTAVWKY
jgi:hypothetical protein